MIELLAPAGSMEALKTGIASGADAIYLAGKMFGARAYADNFSHEELKEAVEYAHMRNVKINVTVNTLVDQSEIASLKDYLEYLDQIGVDAILVQDLGVAYLAKEVVPDMPLHASTQMTVNNLAGVKALEELGFTRVVLAREVSMEDIRHICANTDLEIEIFAHGAICVCYSGQCLMSSMIGGRSGNRGRCAQPCRLPYTLENEDGATVLEDAGDFLLSPKDMNTLELIPELIEAGVASLKLEGRMKKPEYVAIVVNTYRQKINSVYYGKKVWKDLGKNLQEIFNREFTTAYLEKNNGRYMMASLKPNNRGLLLGEVINYRKKTHRAEINLYQDLNAGDILICGNKQEEITVNVEEDVELRGKKSIKTELFIEKPVKNGAKIYRVYNAKLMEDIKGFVQKPEEYGRFPIEFKVYARENELFALAGTDGDSAAVVTADFKVVKALKRPADREYIEKQLNRLGNTIYYLEEVTLETDEGIMIPASVINEARRQVTDELMAKRLKGYRRKSVKKIMPGAVSAQKLPEMTELVVAVDDEAKLQQVIEAGADVILYGGDTYNHRPIGLKELARVTSYCISQGVKIYLGTPRIMRDSETEAFSKGLKDIANLEINGIYAHSLAQMYLIKKYTLFDVWADYSFNTWNEPCLEFLNAYGVKGATLSPELTFARDKSLAKTNILPVECLVHGQTELMVSEYCVLGSFLGGLDKGRCTMPCVKDKFYLRDRKQELMPVRTDANCHMHILNSKTLNMLSYIPDFVRHKIARVRIDGRNIQDDKLADLVRIYKEVIVEGKPHPVFKNNEIGRYENNITRGHYFRGVE